MRPRQQLPPAPHGPPTAALSSDTPQPPHPRLPEVILNASFGLRVYTLTWARSQGAGRCACAQDGKLIKFKAPGDVK